jgi:hypothetical protein
VLCHHRDHHRRVLRALGRCDQVGGARASGTSSHTRRRRWA